MKLIWTSRANHSSSFCFLQILTSRDFIFLFTSLSVAQHFSLLSGLTAVTLSFNPIAVEPDSNRTRLQSDLNFNLIQISNSFSFFSQTKHSRHFASNRTRIQWFFKFKLNRTEFNGNRIRLKRHLISNDLIDGKPIQPFLDFGSTVTAISRLAASPLNLKWNADLALSIRHVDGTAKTLGAIYSTLQINGNSFKIPVNVLWNLSFDMLLSLEAAQSAGLVIETETIYYICQCS